MSSFQCYTGHANYKTDNKDVKLYNSHVYASVKLKNTALWKMAYNVKVKSTVHLGKIRIKFSQ